MKKHIGSLSQEEIDELLNAVLEGSKNDNERINFADIQSDITNVMRVILDLNIDSKKISWLIDSLLKSREKLIALEQNTTKEYQQAREYVSSYSKAINKDIEEKNELIKDLASRGSWGNYMALHYLSGVALKDINVDPNDVKILIDQATENEKFCANVIVKK